MLKLESALVIGHLEGIAICSSFRNHRLVIFILKDRREALQDLPSLSVF